MSLRLDPFTVRAGKEEHWWPVISSCAHTGILSPSPIHKFWVSVLCCVVKILELPEAALWGIQTAMERLVY